MTVKKKLSFEKLTKEHVFKIDFDQRASVLNQLMGALQGHFDLSNCDHISKEELYKWILWACESAKD